MVVRLVEISILEAEELPIGDANGLSDPYVVIDFSPGNVRLCKTSVKYATLNPKWNEVYEVPVDIDAVDGEFLISVKDKDLIGCDHLSYLVVPLKQLLRTGEVDSWFQLTKKMRSYADVGYGRLHLALRIRDYTPPPPSSQAARSGSVVSQNSLSAGRSPSVSGTSPRPSLAGGPQINDAEKRFLYAMEREKSATEQLDENVYR